MSTGSVQGFRVVTPTPGVTSGGPQAPESEGQRGGHLLQVVRLVVGGSVAAPPPATVEVVREGRENEAEDARGTPVPVPHLQSVRRSPERQVPFCQTEQV